MVGRLKAGVIFIWIIVSLFFFFLFFLFLFFVFFSFSSCFPLCEKIDRVAACCGWMGTLPRPVRYLSFTLSFSVSALGQSVGQVWLAAGGGGRAHVGMGVVLCYLILAGCLGLSVLSREKHRAKSPVE